MKKEENKSDTKFDRLLKRRVDAATNRGPIEVLMDVTADIAQFELEDFSKGKVEYNIESISIMESFIKHHRESLCDEKGSAALISIWFGAFLGNVMINEFGGKWEQIEDKDWIVNYQFPKLELTNRVLSSPSVIVLKSIKDKDYEIVNTVNATRVLIMSDLP